MYDVVTELLRAGTLSDEAFAEGERAFGHQLSVEIVTIVGFYSTAGLLGNAFVIQPVGDVPDAMREPRL